MNHAHPVYKLWATSHSLSSEEQFDKDGGMISPAFHMWLRRMSGAFADEKNRKVHGDAYNSMKTYLWDPPSVDDPDFQQFIKDYWKKAQG